MPLAFDTGLAKPQRTLIRDALIARLAPLKIAAGMYLASVVTIPRPIRGDGDDLGLSELEKAAQATAPAVAIAIGGAKPEGGSLDGLEGFADVEIAIYVVSKHARDLNAGRLYGDAVSAASNTKDPGLFAMLEHVRERIHAQDLGVDGVEVPRWAGEDEVLTLEGVTIWEQRYTARAAVTINPDRDATTVMTEIEAQHEGDGISGPEDKPLATTRTTLFGP